VSIETNTVSFRSAATTDLATLIVIEDKAHHYPWPDATLHWAITQKNSFTRILKYHDHIIGFAIFECILDEASLLNIAIDPAYQHQGFGRRLLTDSIRALDTSIERIILEVRTSNHPARKLYQAMGFTELAIRTDYYPTFTGREDAHVLELKRSTIKDLTH